MPYVPAITPRVFTKILNPTAPNSSTPPLAGDTARPNSGAGGTSESAESPSDWPTTHLVSGESSYAASSSATFAARAETWTPDPILSGTSIGIGLVQPFAPNRHELSEITK